MSAIGYPRTKATEIPTPRVSAATAKAAAMAVGPVLVTAGYALHPTGDEKGVAFARNVAEHTGSWAVAHLLIAGGLAVLAAALPSVLRLAPARGRRLVFTGAVLTTIGAAGMALDAIAHGYLAYTLASAPHVNAVAAASIDTHAASSTWASMMSLMGIAFPFGLITTAVGCARAGVPKPIAALLVVGVMGIGAAGAGPLTLITSAPLVAGFIALARMTARERVPA
ncbi:MAG: hypothetical protein QOJ29_698 [Thermoleophilaceae bacterium]|jgi:hypothetical protein|nr:hypothetical protein [Thermoleophilaceae bacterium]